MRPGSHLLASALTPESLASATTERPPSRSFIGWLGLREEKMEVVASCLNRIWQDGLVVPLSGTFVDLGCGDGRVVVEVAARFPERFQRGVGMDLQPDLIRRAKARARRRRVQSFCSFSVADLTSVDLRLASVVFLYFPTHVLPALLARVLHASHLRDGAILISADGALRDINGRLHPGLQPIRRCCGAVDVHVYTWDKRRAANSKSLVPLGCRGTQSQLMPLVQGQTSRESRGGGSSRQR